MKRYIFSFVVIVGLCSAVNSAIINVPGEQPTIHYGIGAANDGDTVLVAPGLYTENIVMAPKSILLISNGTASSTIIQSTAPELNVITFNSGYDNRSIIKGFTIRNGRTGIYIGDNNAPIIMDCVISNNASVASSDYWGGIRCYGNGVVIDKCVFIGNSNHLTSKIGGSVYINADSVLISNCEFYNNSSYNISVISLVNAYNCLIRNNLIYNNINTISGTIDLDDCGACIIANNTISNNSSGLGGGIRLHYSQDSDIRNNIVINNGGNGIAVYPNSVSTIVEYNNVWNNSVGNYLNISAGIGSISEDPLFFDFELLSSSPCINTGDPNIIYNDPDGTRNDMGALPYVSCTSDLDSDGIFDCYDNCILSANASQLDSDDDGIGDECDICPQDLLNDFDGDGICGDIDNCPTYYNPDQLDDDLDGVGNDCDNCLSYYNPEQGDFDIDGIGDSCDTDWGKVYVDNIEGLNSNNQLVPGKVIRYDISMESQRDYFIAGIRTGFRIYSPDGATWDTTFGVVTGTITPEMFEASLFVNEYSITGSQSDTIGFGGYKLFTDGIPSGFKDVYAQVYIGPLSSDNSGKTICLDSSQYYPLGLEPWEWSASGQPRYEPGWFGPYCFEIAESCCFLRGDVNLDATHGISDLTYYVDFLFNAGEEPVCFDEGDINNDEVHGISDLTYFVDYLFNNGSAPPDCP